MIRMPTALHSSLERELDLRISSWLADVKNGPPPFANIAGKIKPTGDETLHIKIGGKIDRRQGDVSFGYRGCGYPGLIIEVSASQSPEKAEEKAEIYIRQTKGAIRTVIHLDANDILEKRGESARFSMWRAIFTVSESGRDVDVVESAKCKVGSLL